MSMNVLLVDDCDLVRSMLAKTLSLSGLPVGHIFHAGNGVQALRIVDEEWVDVILADLNMPVMDGVRMIDHLHTHGLLKTIPVVVVSTEGSQTRIAQLEQCGVTAYVRKPFTPESIRDVIQGVLGEPATDDYGQVLDETFCTVCEQFTLMLADASAQECGDLDMRGWVQAKLSFRGRYSGTLTAAAPKQLVRQFAASALGVEVGDPVAAGSAPEALKELANLTCGRMMTALAGEAAIIELSAPVLTGFAASDWVPRPGSTISSYIVEGTTMALSLSVRSCDT